MKRFFSFLITLFFVLFLSFCGKKGPIFAPRIRTPQGIKTFRAIQKGDTLILEWTNPTTYGDGKALPEIEEIEVWLYEREIESPKDGESPGEGESPRGEESPRRGEPVGIEEFVKNAKIISLIKREVFSWYRIRESNEPESPQFCYFYKLSGKDLASKTLIFSLRIKYRKRKEAAFSDLKSIEPKIIPLPPRKVKANMLEDRIEIRWDPPRWNINQTWPPIVLGYNIYRMEEGGEEELPQRINSRCRNQAKFEDKNFLFGKVYQYFVRAAAASEPPYFESDDSELIEITARDVFPPAVPTGLMSVAGENFVAISWSENREEDLAGYRVWRKAENGDEYILLTQDPIRENTYSDTTVEKNKRYYYAITAQDINGNESQRSELISEIIEDEIP